ncbi:MAG: hypothetical protein VXZ72_05390 [Chlamydiota bacterium]|nr:hypothetical protein [Chlamydiota bacterium]
MKTLLYLLAFGVVWILMIPLSSPYCFLPLLMVALQNTSFIGVLIVGIIASYLNDLLLPNSSIGEHLMLYLLPLLILWPMRKYPLQPLYKRGILPLFFLGTYFIVEYMRIGLMPPSSPGYPIQWIPLLLSSLLCFFVQQILPLSPLTSRRRAHSTTSFAKAYL